MTSRAAMICQVIAYRPALRQGPGPATQGNAPGHEPPAVARLLQAEALLAEVSRQTAPLQPRPATPVYDGLVRAIRCHQLGGAAASAIEQGRRALFDGDLPHPHQLGEASDRDLRATGLSRQKAGYLRDLAAHTTAGQIGKHLRALPDAAVGAAVTAVRGLARWPADMLLILGLDRPDALPVGDFGIRKALQQWYGLSVLPAPAE